MLAWTRGCLKEDRESKPSMLAFNSPNREAFHTIHSYNLVSASMKLFNAMFFQCREQGVENDDLTFIYKQINEPLDVSENITVEEAVLESRLRGNVQAMRLLIRIYYQDFELFGFEFPSVEGEK